MVKVKHRVMKILKSVIIVALLSSLWGLSSIIKTHRLNGLLASGKIPYGPLPAVENDYYSFDGIHSAFLSGLEIRRADEFKKNEFQEIILSSLSANSQLKLKKYLASTLNFSEEYQLDPFWILSVMMVESRFDKTAQSPRNARGLMQIKPDTAEHLYQLMNKKISDEQIERNLHHPEENIEVGVFYLKKLLQNFRLNYNFATIAYNVGPNKLKSLQASDDIDTQNFSYLIKVRESYSELSRNFSIILKNRPKPFESTYVVIDQGRSLENDILNLFTVAHSSNMLTSENLTHFSSKTRAF